MSKIKDVLIIDANTLRLEVDAFKGDEIDLTLLNKVDTSNLLKQIENGKDNLYNQKLNELKQSFLKEKENAINLALKEKELKFKDDLNGLEKDKKDLELEIKNLKSSINDKINLTILNKEKEYLLNIKELESKIEKLNIQLDLEKERIITNYQQKILELEKKYQEELNNKDKQISSLNLVKSSLNVKKLGEELENWCNNEYLSYSQMGFNNCSWVKDNLSVKEDDELKGTKADYIFKVYASEAKLENELLTSV